MIIDTLQWEHLAKTFPMKCRNLCFHLETRKNNLDGTLILVNIFHKEIRKMSLKNLEMLAYLELCS